MNIIILLNPLKVSISSKIHHHLPTLMMSIVSSVRMAAICMGAIIVIGLITSINLFAYLIDPISKPTLMMVFGCVHSAIARTSVPSAKLLSLRTNNRNRWHVHYAIGQFMRSVSHYLVN
jgi:hypothetical protein